MLNKPNDSLRAAALVESTKVNLEEANAISIVLFETANRAIKRNDYVAASFFYKMAAES
jgi:hypothetical protein